ncbi:putative ABC transporter permease [Bariatricus massiliensis]|uniref:ABC transporter permease n=1 Tax=Bariatricus massiliensis TaxID=1745713 RepID=A0ABS8DD56_9FIRM|nr:putative ABC transporter permease [Bariatricus massiliensis]MCB7303501.1 putative ABC transporter permease [Bariatricus massiliensis]MCB7373633.1 putative ABC transporter permease [Bariatricus massiliensis]MCB7386303.1 putative ABC transporter permease [Bariatricus massiliensis]MCB7410465.1 putative ABC transporter permease [Bariatricus massiliensis]MCQ5252251.1 putative ABC transporter permease [Bariatricus massiliensis]
MWWNRIILGIDAYELLMWFLMYSMMGWLVESIYMSICNKKLTNRGFARGPFCPIYGVGALTAYFILRPYSYNNILLFLLGSLCATTLEFLTAMLMKKIFGEIWWDYNEKPFNYKGIICLESSIAWGFYTIFLFMFLQNIVVGLVAAIPRPLGRIAGSLIMVLFLLDFVTSLYREKRGDAGRNLDGQAVQSEEAEKTGKTF